MIKKILSIVLILILFEKTNAVENKILFKIDNQIITSLDIANEYTYLSLINSNLRKLPKDKSFLISKKSIIREKIKESELKKKLDLDKINDNILERIMKTFYLKLKIENKEEFKKLLEKNQLEYDFVKNKIKIESAWNQLIYNKYNSKVKINIEKIKKDISEMSKNTTKNYLLSEIVFNADNIKNLNNKVKIIQNDIKKNGFEQAAYMHSISDTSNDGGKLEWIEENTLNKLILQNISKLKPDEYSSPIRIGGGFIILKVEDIKFEEKKINFDNEVKKIIDFKTNEQLNQFSKIHFEKIKKNIKISEL
jgi:peptidyl-prolyl cis-trans isomerase SurA